LGFEIFKESYAGSIKEITIGQGDKAITVGGETCYPFYQFEGDMPHKTRIAMEVWDMEPDDWPEWAILPFKDVISDPAAWAKKCAADYGADLIVLQLKSTDPNGADASPDEAAATVKKVLDAVNVPLVVWGTSNVQKDEAVLKAVSEACEGKNLIIGPVEDKNHKGIGASAMGFGHTIISSSPIDVNLAKQVNILLENLGMPLDRLLIDPTTGGLGYSLEYTYSVMERLRMAALIQGDDKLQLPIINNLANEVWKSKEAKQTAEEAPTLGDPEKRAILMESVTAVSYLMAGSDILIMRHPEAVRMVRAFIDAIADGGSLLDVAAIDKKLAAVEVDLAALAPKPDLTIEEEKKAPVKKAAPKKAAAPKTAAKPAPKKEAKPVPEKVVELKPAAEEKPAADDADAKLRAEVEARIRAEMDAKTKADVEAKAAVDAAAKAEADATAKAKAEADAKAKEAADLIAKLAAEELALQAKIGAERKGRLAQLQKAAKEAADDRAVDEVPELDKMLIELNRIHRRVA